MTSAHTPEHSRVFSGIGIGRGVGIGRIRLLVDTFVEPSTAPSSRSADEEQQRLQAAMDQVTADLKARSEQASGEAQDILMATVEISSDPEIVDQAVAKIAEGHTAERAIFESFAGFIAMIEPLGGYFAERVTDLQDVSKRIVQTLDGTGGTVDISGTEPLIVVATDLAPADTATFDASTIAGMVTVQGGPTSHTAILAGLKGIPALVGTSGALEAQDGAVALIDAARGELTINPSEEQLAEARDTIQRRAEAAQNTNPGQLADGTPIQLFANIGGAADTASAIALGAEGVGLFRTEFLFLDSQTAPTVDEQYEQYRQVLAAFPGQKVVVRLLDAGSDKPMAFLPEQHEENPALGLRGIRMLRTFTDVLDGQLDALARADAETESDLWVMAPMIADVADTEYFVAKAKSYGLKTVGVMAEVPSSAVLAAEIAEIADFISIGTNDLTQYTLAADRMLNTVDQYHDSGHPAVLRLIKMICDGAASHGKPVSVCGEAGGDPRLAVILVGLGVTSLSMSAHSLADVREELLKVTLEEAQQIAADALK